MGSHSNLEYMRAYRLTNKEKLLDYARDYRKSHPEKAKERGYTYSDRLKTKERRHLLKVKVLSYYSNPQGIPICNSCGEQAIDVLCIDHIEGGGCRQAKSLSTTLYYWLVKNNFPSGFQVLCANCNLKKKVHENTKLTSA